MTKKTAPAPSLKTVTLIIGAALIQKAVDSIGRRTALLKQDVQVAGLSIMQHVATHGDTTLADKLYNGLGKGSRRDSLVLWMVTHSQMRVLSKEIPEEAAAIKAGRIFQYDKSKALNMEDAQKIMWCDAKAESAPEDTFDVHAAVKNLMARIASAQKKGLVIEGVELIDALKAIKYEEKTEQ